MITVDDANRVVDYNPAARNLLVRLVGGLDEDTLLGANLTDLVGPWPDLLTCLTSTHLSERDIELRLADERYYYECRVVAIGGPRARDLARLVVLHDITERKEAEATLRDSMLELQSTNEQLDAFAHTVAHDLKDPLNTLTGYAQLLEAYWNKLPQEDIEVYLASIRQTGTQMTRIIDALLLLSRTYRLEDVALEAVDMEVVVAEAVHRVSAAVNTQDIQLVMPERWPWVMGYAPWIVEVWANYLSNAIKYGGERRRVALGFEDAPGSDGDDRGEAASGQIRFWVHDDGPGLTSAQQAHLFRPFVRFHPSRGDGTGLGLTIVQRIIEKLGGHVGVKSEPGHGSTFWFTLPDLGAGSESSNQEV